MLTFNEFLEAAGIDPRGVRLARHQTKEGNLTPWALWRKDVGAFELYQRIQRRPRFRGASHVASFVVTPDGRTLFVGLYDVGQVGVVPEGMIDPVKGIEVAGFNLYDLTRSEALDAYAGRLVVDWGDGQRAWVQRADRQPKPIVELVSAMESLPTRWRDSGDTDGIMRDFRVALVTYAVEHDEGLYYGGDVEPLVFETPLFRAILAQDRLQFLLKGDFDDPGAAADAVRPFVEAWEGKAREERPEDGFRLEFEGAQIVTLRPEGETPLAMGTGKATEANAAPPGGRAIASYPPPPAWPDLPADGGPPDWSDSEGRRLPWPYPVASAPIAAGPDFPPSDASGGGTSGEGYWGGDSYWGSSGQGGEGEAQGPELAETVAQAVGILEEIRETLSAQETVETAEGAESATPGIGHNNPPPDLDDARAVVGQGLEALAEEAPNVERLVTIRAALKWLGEQFTTFAEAFAKSAGTIAAPAAAALLATQIPQTAQLFGKIISMLR